MWPVPVICVMASTLMRLAGLMAGSMAGAAASMMMLPPATTPGSASAPPASRALTTQVDATLAVLEPAVPRP